MAVGDVITGVEGSISIDATDIDITLFTINTTGAVIDVTDTSSSGWRTKLPGKFKQWTGTAEVYKKVGTAELEPNVSYAFIGTAETTNGTVTYTGNISITEIVDNVPVEAEEAAQVTFNFEGLGALTKVSTSP